MRVKITKVELTKKAESEMTETPLRDSIPRKVSSRFPRWALIALGCVVLAIAAWIFIKVRPGGYYAVEDVILSSGLEDSRPVDIRNVFKPSDTVICTVKTTGIDGLTISTRWYLGNDLIYESTEKTQNNTMSIAIRSSKSFILPEGKYHLDLSMYDVVFRTVYFEVKAYHPTVKPPIAVPGGHKSVELPWYPEVPFAFDEMWTTDSTDWKVNEVKVVLRDDTPEYFVSVVIETDSDLQSMSESEAKQLTRPIALYALENGYIDKARELQIDGEYYDLDQYIIVSLQNPASQLGYRAKFTMDELAEPVQ